ncbi:MAG TPA: hypothetical protein VEJ84_14105 [Acidimicrobiales bacterium]|nr:hypothetical protein [Acidimicrobiales bacterium]
MSPPRAEARAILAGAPPRFRAAIASGVNGCRIGEVLGTTASRLDLERRRHVIDRQLQRIGGAMCFTSPKREKARTIALPQLVALELRRHLRDHQGGGLSFHSLRHFCASSMLADGVPRTAVAGHLGDTIETVERVYAHWLRDDTEVPAIAMDRLLAVEVDEVQAIKDLGL